MTWKTLGYLILVVGLTLLVLATSAGSDWIDCGVAPC